MSYATRTAPQDLRALFVLSLRCYWPMLCRLFIWILAFTAIKDLNLYWFLISSNRLVLHVMSYLQWAAMIYLFCCIIRVAHLRLQGAQPVDWRAVLRHSVQASIKVAAFILLFAVIFIVLFYIGLLFSHFVAQLKPSAKTASAQGKSLLPYVILLSFLFSYALIRFVFVLPLLSIHQASLLDVIVRSNELTARYWLRLSVFYAFVLLVVLLSAQTTQVSFWAARYYSNFFIDLAYFSIVIPIFCTLLLFLLDDLTERFEVAESK